MYKKGIYNLRTKNCQFKDIFKQKLKKLLNQPNKNNNYIKTNCSDSEQIYFASILEALRGLGHDQLWLGGSDIGSDGNWRWSDGSPIEKYYWQAGYPKNVQS